MPRVTKEPEERKQEILETAMRLFYEKGYEQTSMVDIAKELQVAQGLCYRYFPSKEALFDTAIDQYAQVLVDRMAVDLKQPGLTLGEIIMQMPTFLETEQEENNAYQFCHGPEKRKVHSLLSLRVCAKMQPIVEELLNAANERGETRIADPEAAASFCVYGQLGILLQMELPGEERVRRIKAQLLELFHGLSG